MKPILNACLLSLTALLAAQGVLPAQVTNTPAAVPPPSAPAKRSPAELEKLAAPIAIYPDPLLALILPAAVYPVEIVQAARFVKNTNNLPKLDQQPWDEKVRSVARFPDMIAMMDANLGWTVELGQAFLAQPDALMDAIQALRAKAQAAGNLKTTPQQVVTSTNAIVERLYEGQVIYVTNTVIQIQPATTNIVYVPSYNPTVIYVDDDDDAAAAVVSFGVGMAFGAAMWGHCDWHYGGCWWGYYPPPPPPFPPPWRPPPGYRPPPGGGWPPGYRPPPGAPPPGTRPPGARPPGTATTLPAQRWQPDQSRLASAGAPSASTREARGWNPGGSASTLPAAGAGNLGTRPSTGAVGTRPSTGAVGTRPSTGGGNLSMPAPAPTTRPAPSTTPSSGGYGNSAFGGVNNASASRNYSSRGSVSRGGGGFGGGRGGGGRGR
jgi:uncharacterized membrane protein YgcG